MRVKCYSVRLAGLVSVSDLAYRATAYDGSSDIIPKSQGFGQDHEVQKSDAYWLSAWILEKRSIQYSTKKEAWFDSDTGDRLPTITVTKHKPEKLNPLESNTIKRLKK